MAIIEASDIKTYLSGGASNTDPNASLGGKISSEELGKNLHDLFPKVGAAEAVAGSTKYRAIFIKNEHETLSWEDIKLYIKSQTTSNDTKIEVGKAHEGKSDTIETIANDTTAPASVTFTDTTIADSGQSLGNLEAGDCYGIWVKRIVDANANAFGADECKLGQLGETTDDGE